MDENKTDFIPVIESLLMASNKPLSIDRIHQLLAENIEPAASGHLPSKEQIQKIISSIAEFYQHRSIELVAVSSGFRFQIRANYAQWVNRLWAEKPQKFSRALLETLALIAYKQPITRGDIEEIRGVSVSSQIIRTLMERDWIRVIGHRDVPGKPAIYATTKQFLDYFSLSRLDELPPLSDFKDPEELDPELDLGFIEHEAKK